MISRTFITEYLKLFFPNYDERYLDLLEISVILPIHILKHLIWLL